MASNTHSFNLTTGRVIAKKYEVLAKLGEGWEGEVYSVREIHTGIEHAAKLFFPQRDKNNTAVTAYAKKLHKLRNCSMVMRYHTEEYFQFNRKPVMILISELIEGVLLSEYVQRRRGRRLEPYEALHIIYELSKGLAEIHALNEYHGDLHSGNIILTKSGVRFEFKLMDMYFRGKPSRAHLADDVFFLVELLYELVGGAKHYRHQPDAIKQVCKGLKRSLIIKNAKNAKQLREYIETLSW